jgi:hypothetical protein
MLIGLMLRHRLPVRVHIYRIEARPRDTDLQRYFTKKRALEESCTGWVRNIEGEKVGSFVHQFILAKYQWSNTNVDHGQESAIS